LPGEAANSPTQAPVTAAGAAQAGAAPAGAPSTTSCAPAISSTSGTASPNALFGATSSSGC
jgi:hypothetical protein